MSAEHAGAIAAQRLAELRSGGAAPVRLAPVVVPNEGRRASKDTMNLYPGTVPFDILVALTVSISPIVASEIQLHSGAKKQSITPALTRLHKHGYVERRAVYGAGPGRQYQYRPTELGLQVVVDGGKHTNNYGEWH